MDNIVTKARLEKLKRLRLFDDDYANIVFKDKVLKYEIGNQAEKATVCSECRKMGILDEQMNWSE